VFPTGAVAPSTQHFVDALKRKPQALERLHSPPEVKPTCLHWYLAFPLSLCHLEQIMVERGAAMGHSTLHHWALNMLLARQNGRRFGSVTAWWPRMRRKCSRAGPGLTSERDNVRHASIATISFYLQSDESDRPGR
jgi:hypothetical protein